MIAAAAFALFAQLVAPGGADASARAVVLSFDDAWNHRDVGALMAPISSRFGCDMYGEINVSHVESTLRSLLDHLRGSTCRTEIVELAGDDPVIRVFARRRIQNDGRTVEELNHVLYLRREPDGLKVTGLEDFDPVAFGRLSPPLESGARRYENPRLAYRFVVPADTFAVPAPPIGAALDHVFVRAADLGDEIELFVIQTAEPFEVERALDRDLEAWTTQVDRGVVETRETAWIRGARAERATARYLGASCALIGGESAKSARRMVRTYAQLDRRFLLAIDLRASEERFPSARATLDALLESIAFDAAPGADYGRLVTSRNDCGVVADGKFRCARTGFALDAPEGFSLERVATNAQCHLVATVGTQREGETAIEVHVEAEALMDPATTLGDFAMAQDLALEACVGERGGQLTVTPRADRSVGGEPSVVAERRVKTPDGTRVERCAYFVKNGVAYTLRVESTPALAADAAAALTRILDRVRFTAN